MLELVVVISTLYVKYLYSMMDFDSALSCPEEVVQLFSYGIAKESLNT